jgi:hypothetical protein
MLDEADSLLLEQRVSTTPDAIKEAFGVCRAAASRWDGHEAAFSQTFVERVGT